jgi:hypothetical protein
MDRKRFAPLTLVVLFPLISTCTSQVTAANIRSFIEGVRRKAGVVYVGSVKELRQLERTKFDIKARAVVDVSAVIRSPGTNPRKATIEYSSYNDKTPMLAGSPQSQLSPGIKLVVFTNLFASNIPPGYLIQGTSNKLLQRVEALCDAVKQMSPGQLEVHEINEEDRRISLTFTKSFARTSVHPNNRSCATARSPSRSSGVSGRSSMSSPLRG